MGSLFEWITDWIKEGLIDAITGQYTSIFNSVNNQVADVANQVGQTPQGWNGGVFSMIQNLSETVVIPIAGMILTFVLVYELIQMEGLPRTFFSRSFVPRSGAAFFASLPYSSK